MYRHDISVIRAVHSDRIRRDIHARHRAELPSRSSAFRAFRRAIGRSIVRLGVRIASEPAASLELARSR